MSRYKLGPWRHMYEGLVVQTLTTEDGTTINLDVAQARKSTYHAGKYIRTPKEVVEQRGRLIAAAPDLLAALKQAEAALGLNEQCWESDIAPAKERARAAIAKAEGK